MGIINDRFLLQTETAYKLYQAAKDMPIIDYHCHIVPADVAEDRKFENITKLWLGGDHYKWRLIRSNGIPENEITGDADDYTKFRRFAEMLPNAIGNPMYHWCHLELKHYFDYDGCLNGDTAEEVYRLCNEKLQDDSMSAKNLIRRSNVKMIGTTDDPADDLKWHKMIAEDKSFSTAVCPTFRPDNAVNIDKAGFSDYIRKLESAANIRISSVDDVKEALSNRLDFFCNNGCRATDHGLNHLVFSPASESEVNRVFKKVMNGETLTELEADEYKTELMLFLGQKIAEKNLVMQLHYNVQRNTNAKMFAKLGPDMGFDCMGDRLSGEILSSFLSELDKNDKLPKTVIYSLNPGDNEMIDSIIGAFQGIGAAGKIQHGSGWWFNDTKSGMEDHLRSLGNLTLLGNFIGMLTDSRSLLSYTRHEYFRRILCNFIGNLVENGEYPNDEKELTRIVQNISYGNAARYFNI